MPRARRTNCVGSAVPARGNSFATIRTARAWNSTLTQARRREPSPPGGLAAPPVHRRVTRARWSVSRVIERKTALLRAGFDAYRGCHECTASRQHSVRRARPRACRHPEPVAGCLPPEAHGQGLGAARLVPAALCLAARAGGDRTERERPHRVPGGVRPAHGAL